MQQNVSMCPQNISAYTNARICRYRPGLASSHVGRVLILCAMPTPTPKSRRRAWLYPCIVACPHVLHIISSGIALGYLITPYGRGQRASLTVEAKVDKDLCLLLRYTASLLVASQVLLIRVDALSEEQVVQLLHLVVALGGPSICTASPL
jgi:hypothetical protein